MHLMKIVTVYALNSHLFLCFCRMLENYEASSTNSIDSNKDCSCDDEEASKIFPHTTVLTRRQYSADDDKY